MNANCKGHTLIELLIAMALSMLIISALVSVNILSVRSILQIRQTEKQINLLSQSLKLIETDLKSTAVRACAIDKTFILDSLSGQTNGAPDSLQFNWISGYSDYSWFPRTPDNTNQKQSKSFDAVQLARAEVSNVLTSAILEKTPQRIVFITDCMVSEITRSIDSMLLKHSTSPADLSIYAFQVIQYYIRENSGNYSLYRQYLSKTGTTVNEPMIDNIARFQIGYGERISDTALTFNTASKVTDWNDVIAVYVSLTITGASDKPVSILVLLDNHAAYR